MDFSSLIVLCGDHLASLNRSQTFRPATAVPKVCDRFRLRQWNQSAPPFGFTASFNEGFGNSLFAARTQNLAVKQTRKHLFNSVLARIERGDFSIRVGYAG
jgi:hypothetical protein